MRLHPPTRTSCCSPWPACSPASGAPGRALNQPEAVALLSCWVHRGRPRRPLGGRPDGAGRRVLGPRRRDGGRAGDRRARSRSRRRSPTAASSSRSTTRSRDPGRARHAARASSSSTPGASGRRARSQHRRPADPGRLALPLRRGQPALEFDREAARGLRLDVPAGTSVRFEPGATREVDAGRRSAAPDRARAARAAPGRRVSRDRAATATPRCTARPSATGSGSPTPTCCIEVERTAARAATRRSSAAAR